MHSTLFSGERRLRKVQFILCGWSDHCFLNNGQVRCVALTACPSGTVYVMSNITLTIFPGETLGQYNSAFAEDLNLSRVQYTEVLNLPSALANYCLPTHGIYLIRPSIHLNNAYCFLIFNSFLDTSTPLTCHLPLGTACCGGKIPCIAFRLSGEILQFPLAVIQYSLYSNNFYGTLVNLDGRE